MSQKGAFSYVVRYKLFHRNMETSLQFLMLDIASPLLT